MDTKKTQTEHFESGCELTTATATRKEIGGTSEIQLSTGRYTYKHTHCEHNFVLFCNMHVCKDTFVV